MSDNDIIDIILKDLHAMASRPCVYLNATILKPKNILIDSSRIKRIVQMMTSKDLAIDNPTKANTVGDFCLTLGDKGLDIMTQFGSYLSFLKSLDKAQTKTNREKYINKSLSFVATIGIIWGGTFTYLNYNKTELLKQKDNKIEQLQKTIDSLKIMTTIIAH